MKFSSLVRLLVILPFCLILGGSCSRADLSASSSSSTRSASQNFQSIRNSAYPRTAANLPRPAAALSPQAGPEQILQDQPNQQSQQDQTAQQNQPAPRPLTIGETWLPLWEKLRADGLNQEEIAYLFIRLEDPSQDPMGRKIQELYTNQFIRPPRPASTPDTSPNDTGIPRPWYRGFVTEANAKVCRTFINAHADAFKAAEEEYGIPPEVGAALLFVETRLGEYLGEHNAFLTLASMAISRSPEAISDWMEKLPGIEDHLDWVNLRMADKADWAYSELRALLRYCLENGIDPFQLPSSAYGAIGLCQFMPSNLSRYAVDGNGDGIIDLFDQADAIASLSNYLGKHGWKLNMSVDQQIKVLKRYNNLSVYANTILALAAKVSQIPGRPAVNRALPKPPGAITNAAN